MAGQEGAGFLVDRLSQEVVGAGVTDIKLDGMQVVFDKKVAATPVSLDYKKKKSNAN